MNVRKYKHSATFTREVQVSDPAREITGVISYMTCNDEACIFPDPVKFTVNVSTGALSIGDEPLANACGHAAVQVQTALCGPGRARDQSHG